MHCEAGKLLSENVEISNEFEIGTRSRRVGVELLEWCRFAEMG